MYASCIVRQPVFDRNNALLGYEIRFPDNEDGRQALARSILSGSFDIFRGGLPAFVSCNRSQLLDTTFQSIDPKHVVLMLANDVPADDEVVAALENIKASGGVAALDTLHPDGSPAEALAEHVEWVRIDLRDDDAELIGRMCDRVWHARPRFLADQVLEESQYDVAHEMGFDGFQGPLFSRAEPVPAAEMPSSTVAAMRLLGLARDPNVSDRALEEAVSTDAVLTFQLLRLVNSAAVGVKGVTSIGHALRIIGRSSFLRWLSLAIAASRGAKTGVDQHLVRQAVERGRLLEQLNGKGRDAGTLFLVGLFSLMDAVFRLPLHDIVARVALGDEAKSALLDRTGPYAQALAFAEAYELGLFESAAQHAEQMGVTAEKLPDIYAASICWTAEALGSMNAPAPAQNERKLAAR
ncbi:MAG: HDOD domain-containing protein [Phycisphaerae bacterium]|nr:HDOD domain-containing protein [Gemmatimonadaceae bacterium]